MIPSTPKPPLETGEDAFSQTLLYRFASMVESSDDAIVSKNLDGTVVTWNRAATDLYGYTAEEMVGQSIKILAGEERLAEEEDILARLRAGERVQHFETIRLKKG